MSKTFPYAEITPEPLFSTKALDYTDQRAQVNNVTLY